MTGYVIIDGVEHRAALSGNAGAGFRLERGQGPEAIDAAGVVDGDAAGAVVARDGDALWVHLDGAAYRIEWRDAVAQLATAAGAGVEAMRAPMPGSVIAVEAAAGQAVAAGDVVMIIESMKLETAIRAPRAGVVAAVHFGVGDRFDRDALLAVMDEAG